MADEKDLARGADALRNEHQALLQEHDALHDPPRTRASDSHRGERQGGAARQRSNGPR